MKLTRKLFYNKRNGQATVTLPSKVLKDLQRELNCKRPLDKLSFKILNKTKK